MSVREWTDFFQDAGISSSEAQTYKAAFAQHNIRSDMLEDLDKEDLRDMGITAIGDIKRILKYAKKEMLDRTTKKECTLSNQIEGWIKAENVKSKQVNDDITMNEDINNDKVTKVEDEDNDQVMARVEEDIPDWRNETRVAVPMKEGSIQSNKCSKSASENANMRSHHDAVNSMVTKLDDIPLDKNEINVSSIVTEIFSNRESSLKMIPSPDNSSGHKNGSSPLYETQDFSQWCVRNQKKDQDKKHLCEICEKSFKSQGGLSQHVKKDHLQTRPLYSCDACQFSSKYRPNVLQHKKVIHYKMRPYKCDKCPKTATQRSKMKDHIRKFHGGRGMALIEADESVETDDLTAWRDACKFSCRYCPEVTTKRYEMINHGKKKHRTKGSGKHYVISEVADHECLVCKKLVQRESRQLNDHMLKTHAFNLATYEEKYYFPSLNEMKNHSGPPNNDSKITSGRSLHLKNGNKLKMLSWRNACTFACNSCSKVVSNRFDMMLHCREEHGINGTKSHYCMLKKVMHTCLLCKKLVLHETDILNNHMVEMHSINLTTYEEKHYFPSLKR